MKRKLFIGIVVILGLAVAPLLIAGALVAVWIYLAWMVWKSKTDIFDDQMEPELVEKRLKKLKTLLVIAGICFAVFIIGVIVHNALSALSDLEEEPVSFFIALVALFVFVIATIGSLVIFRKGRRRTT